MKPFFALLCLYFSMNINAQQVGINTVNPDVSAVMDIVSNSRGLLIPRLTTTQKLAITTPASGLMVYDTTESCLNINTGTPTSPIWQCQEKKPVSTSTNIPATVISNSVLTIRDNEAPSGQLNYQQWVDVPGLSITFTLAETRTLNLNWTLFTGITNNDGSTLSTDLFAQMFTCISITGGTFTGNVADSTNYLSMIHNPGGANYFALMNNNTNSYITNLPAGTYTVKVRVYAAGFLGNLNGVLIGANSVSWTGGTNMTSDEKSKAASNKLTVSFL